MRVHHVVPHFYPEVGGVESHVLRLSEYLVSRGHEAVVHTSRRDYSGRPLPESDVKDGIRIRRYRSVFRLGYYVDLFTPDLDGADVVHLHGYGHLANDWSARHTWGPAAYSLHHGVAQPAPSVGARLKRSLYDPLVGLRTLRRVSAIVAQSEADRTWLESRSFPADRVNVIPNGIPEEAFLAGDPEAGRRRAGSARYVLFLGRLQREKSPDHLVRALPLLPRDVGLVFAGPDAGARQTVEAAMAFLGVQNRVSLAGLVDEPTKRDLIAGCEALVLPSFYEAQGIAILEAWAQSRPVVASRVGGVPFLVDDGADGLLYPWGDTKGLADCLNSLLGDPARGRHMGEEGRNKARSAYRWTVLAPRFLELYEALMRGGARG